MAQLNLGKVGVLMGGPSTEREISLKSGSAVYESLKQAGVDAVAVDIKTEEKEDNARLLRSSMIDIAFIALHGRFGEDGQVQGILEELDIPYTGSGVKASRLAMDKAASRGILEGAGLAVPRYKTEQKSFYRKDWVYRNDDFSLPLVVKPSGHGSSVGLSIVEKEENFESSAELAFSFDEKIIIEEYIKGREMTVGILGKTPLPVIEIVPKRQFFDYEAKYHAGMTDYVVPARLDEEAAARLQQAALSAHVLLGCYGCSRVDIILSDDGVPFILEVNTIPGLTATSLLPKAAKVIGIDFFQLCAELIRLGYEKKKDQIAG
ncbi:MAG: D-alanine--D-alanine ligase [Candidatus Omnitrophota bacterium]|jgi:D-alanine-D-alanine ligase